MTNEIFSDAVGLRQALGDNTDREGEEVAKVSVVEYAVSSSSRKSFKHDVAPLRVM